METDLHKKHCTIGELDHQFKKYDIVLNNEFREQIILDLYLVSRDMSKLPQMELLEHYWEDSDEEED